MIKNDSMMCTLEIPEQNRYGTLHLSGTKIMQPQNKLDVASNEQSVLV